MADSPKPKKISDLLEKVHESLKRSAWFEAERIALKALAMARQAQDFHEMSLVIPRLQEARQQRTQKAVSAARNKIAVIDGPITEDMKIRAGCYLVQPPHVGSDARRFRLMA